MAVLDADDGLARAVNAAYEGMCLGSTASPAALGAALACFLIRLAGIRYNINAPIAREEKSKPIAPEVKS